jgi:hypothetical protein
MRRLRLILTFVLVCVAAATFVSGAAAGNFDKTKMGCTGDAPAVCPTGTVGQGYSLTIYLLPPDGGRGEDFACATFHVTSGDFPPGLSISDEGLISGTPTAAGQYRFYLTVRYDKPNCPFKTASDDEFIININAAKPKLTVSTASLPDANINQPYTAPALVASGDTVNSWTLAGGALPPGLTLAANGVISGTPTQAGAFGFTVQANGNGTSDTKQLSIFVLAPLELQSLTGKKPPTIGWTSKKAVNASLVTGVKAVGGRAPYTFASTGVLPPGITLNTTTGALTGAGTTAGRFESTITVTDATGAKASVPWRFTIVPLLDFAKLRGLPVGQVDRLYSARIPVTGKDARTAEFAISGKIPPGLELDETTGRLTGTLLRAGTYRVRVYAFSESGAPVSKIFTIRVRA